MQKSGSARSSYKMSKRAVEFIAQLQKCVAGDDSGNSIWIVEDFECSLPEGHGLGGEIPEMQRE